LSGARVTKSAEELVEKLGSEGRAAVIDIGSRLQAGQVGMPLGVSKMSQTSGVAACANAATAHRIVRGSSATAVRPNGRLRGWCGHTPRDDQARPTVAVWLCSRGATADVHLPEQRVDGGVFDVHEK
jgi:hypothetical protein